MSAHNIRKLIFSYIPNPKLVKEAIGWDIKDRFSEIPVQISSLENGAAQKGKNRRFSRREHRMVLLVFILLSELSDEALASRAQEVRSLDHVFKIRNFPNFLNEEETDILAKNAQWMRYETCLALHGFVLSARSRSSFFNSVIGNKNIKPELLTLPLFESFFTLDHQLKNSGVFEKRTYASPQDKAASIEIINWLKTMEISMPQGLAKRVEHFFGNKEEFSGKRNIVNPKERTSMLLLINAMARAKFKYEPGKSLGPAKRAIDLAIQDIGLQLSEKTIGEYLKASQREIDKQRENK